MPTFDFRPRYIISLSIGLSLEILAIALSYGYYIAINTINPKINPEINPKISPQNVSGCRERGPQISKFSGESWLPWYSDRCLNTFLLILNQINGNLIRSCSY